MGANQQSGLSKEELVSTMHWVLHTELTLDRPVGDVWPVFRDMRRWYTEYSFEIIGGPPYQTGLGFMENQVIKVASSKGLPRTSNSEESGGPEYFIQKTLKVDPQQEIVAVLSGSAYDWRRVTSFYVWRLTEKAKQTTVLVDTYGEAEFFQPMSPTELAAYYERLERNWYRSWSEAFANLRNVMGANA